MSGDLESKLATTPVRGVDIILAYHVRPNFANHYAAMALTTVPIGFSVLGDSGALFAAGVVSQGIILLHAQMKLSAAVATAYYAAHLDYLHNGRFTALDKPVIHRKT